jgi:surfeit locus 1 family protein
MPPTLVTVVLLAALLSLGFWQLERMRQKQALFASFAAGTRTTVDLASLPPGSEARYQHARVAGRYDATHQILLDNMTHEGMVGYRVLTPLRFGADRTLLVDRGWIALGASREQIPDVAVNANDRTVAGRLDELPRAGIHLATQINADTGWPRVMSYPSMQEVLAVMAREVYPYILLLDADQPDGFVREWRPATFPPERHLGYAITWFALAGALLVSYTLTQVHRAGDEP